jgi:2-phospho-L-lactate transferase/gluconeogenesis factor (CofD/UPF0052 family)/8-oxo-dGTP pyrophosphatase MutT (NUDIX family)
MPDEQLAALDEQGNLLEHGVLRSRAHREGLWHRTVSIFVLNPYGEILLEKRSRHQDLFPGFYDIPGGHVQFGCSPAATAEEELREELRVALTAKPTALCREDGIEERVVLPEKGIINLERKTVYLVEITESQGAGILFHGAEVARLTARELEKKGTRGEVSRIEFWSWEKLNRALRATEDRVLASGTESSLSDPAIRGRVAERCHQFRAMRRRAFAEIKGNPLHCRDWDTRGDETLFKAVYRPPHEQATPGLVAAAFEGSVDQTAGAYQLGSFRHWVAGDDYWFDKIEDPWRRYVDNLIEWAGWGRDPEIVRKFHDAKEDIYPFVEGLLNFPLQDGSRFRDRLGNLADIAVAREAVLLWLRHNLDDAVFSNEDLKHPTRAITDACLDAGRRLLTECMETTSATGLARLGELVRLSLKASAADLNNPRFQRELFRRRPGAWIFDFLQSGSEGELSTELGGERFLEEFFDEYVKPKRPLTLAFLPGNSGQAYFSLAVCQELLALNPSMRIRFLPKSDSPGTDLSFENALSVVNREQDGVFRALFRHVKDASFLIQNGPIGHGLDPGRLSRETAEALADANVIWAEGQAYAEIRGWKRPVYVSFRVNGRVAEAIHGVSRARGACGFVRLTPGVDHFEGFEGAVHRRIPDLRTGVSIPAATQTTSEYVEAILGDNFSSIVNGLFHGNRQEACRAAQAEASRLGRTFAEVFIGAALKVPDPAVVREHFLDLDCEVFACGGGGGFNGVTLKALRMLGRPTAAGVPSTDDGGSTGEIQRQLRSKCGFIFGVGDMAGILQECLDDKGKQAILAYRLDQEPDDLAASILDRISIELRRPTYSESFLGAAPDFLSFVSAQLNLARIIDRSFRKGQTEPLRVRGSSIRNLNLIAAYELCGSLGDAHSPDDPGRMAALYVLFQALGLHSAPIVLPVSYDDCTLFLEYGEPVREELARQVEVPPDAIDGNRLYGQQYIDKLPQPGSRRTCGVVASGRQAKTPPRANPAYLERLRGAKLFIMGAGSLFGSQLAQLAVPGVVDVLLGAKSMRRLLVINHVRMDETWGMSLGDHIRVIEAVANDSASPNLVKQVAPVGRLRISDLFTDIIVPRTVAKEVEAEMARREYRWDSSRDHQPEFFEIPSNEDGGTPVRVLRNRYVDFLLQHPEVQLRLQITHRELEVLSYLDQPPGLYSHRSEAGRYRGALYASDQDFQYLLDQGIQARNIHQVDSIGQNWKLTKSEGSPRFEFFPGLVPEALMGIIRIALERGTEEPIVRDSKPGEHTCSTGGPATPSRD